jgi:hypothetical protein
MDGSHRHERFADDLHEVAETLRDQRPELDALGLDRVKLRAMSAARRSDSSSQKGFFMRSRLTAFLAAAFLSVGTGGALALAGGGGSGHHDGGSAGFDQYRTCDHGKGGGRDHECHGHEGEEHGQGNGQGDGGGKGGKGR